ncbi:MAG: molybdopterin converting factor subunit 1 [Sphingomonas sp.]|jgi:sulfur-carrier protein|uniref:molybdopterin converting factor subunit 1 n=1 Tax=Sphingomonas sp. TaxID=28214 RepID=UPI0026014372|nr:molybdopterin converting factor subunit 1 [Sphingomonas sp.]MBX9881826.1 molybdopterin converting factor subunit 1 [Sphingomonas sp.]
MELLYFAWVREKMGRGGERVAPPAEVETVAQLIAWLRARGPVEDAALADSTRLRAAVDQVFVGLDASIKSAREVALFPPVTGG